MPTPSFLPGRLLGIAASMRASLAALVQRAAGRAALLAAETERRHAQRPEVVEVHLPDGQVAYVEAQRGGSGGTLIRVAWRVLRAAMRWIAGQLPTRGGSRPAGLVLLPVRVRTEGSQHRNHQ